MNTTAFDAAIAALMEHTQFLPSDQIVNELKLVQERLKFIPEILKQNQANIEQSLTQILQDDISPEVLKAIVEMTGQDQFDVVRANTDLFLEACQHSFSQFKEIIVTVAVPVDNTFKEKVATQIRSRLTEPMRVIYQVQPSIIAGIIIHEPDGVVYDYSLRASALPAARQWLKRKINSETAK